MCDDLRIVNGKSILLNPPLPINTVGLLKQDADSLHRAAARLLAVVGMESNLAFAQAWHSQPSTCYGEPAQLITLYGQVGASCLRFFVSNSY
jgi:hypothetical protein